MQIPILSGNFADSTADFRTSYPVNMVPVPKQQGISNGYLRPADGIVQAGTGPGVDRGGINWNGVLYRVMGTKLVSISASGVMTTLGDVGTGGLVTMDYSFDRLAIASGGNLFYWDESALTQVTDADLGTVLDVQWIDGYFMTTDGEFLVVTELTDPLAVNPLKYGSSEVDPDPIKALLKVRNEIYAVNRYTIEGFDNIGGDLFPFQRIDGAQITKGAVGTHACCEFQSAIAFLGGGRNEAPGVYIGINAGANKISSREIDTVLSGFTESQLSGVKLEARMELGHQFLYVHLPDRTCVYDHAASAAIGEAVWFILISSSAEVGEYRAKNLVWCYDAWNVGDTQSAAFGTLTNQTGNHWGQRVRWEFGTSIVYNGGMGVIFHDLELVALTGRVDADDNPRISTSYSVDGQTWSQDKSISCGKRGALTKRLLWLQQGSMRNWRIQRFRGDSSAHISPARLEARLEPLAY